MTLLIDRGEYLLAYDQVRQRLRARPRDPRLRYYSALTLALAGAAGQAGEELPVFTAVGDVGRTPELVEDVDELRAQLATRRALEATGAGRNALAREAAAGYEKILQRHWRPQDCLDAAAMWLVSGDAVRARRLARTVLAHCNRSPSSTDDFGWKVRCAEAKLLLGDPDGARERLDAAPAVSTVSLRQRVAARRRLLFICNLLGVGDDVLASVTVPAVVHYCGHRIQGAGIGRFPAEAESATVSAVAAHIERDNVGFAYGSLASGADVICAEAVLRRSAELHVVLPFALEDFVRESVRPGGPTWVGRFHACLDRATSVSFATTGRYLGDDSLYAHTSALAMGGALLQARALTAVVSQLAVWDGVPTGEPAGTAQDVAVWSALGLPIVIIRPGLAPAPGPRQTRPVNAVAPREVRAVVVVDVHADGLDVEANRRLVELTLLRAGAAVDRYDDEGLLCRVVGNDRLSMATTSVVTAGRCAIAVRESVRDLGVRTDRRPLSLQVHVVAHARPASRAPSPCEPMTDHSGAQTRTPPGEVYVTESFAELLELESPADLHTERVGRLPGVPMDDVSAMYVLKETAVRP